MEVNSTPPRERQVTLLAECDAKLQDGTLVAPFQVDKGHFGKTPLSRTDFGDVSLVR